jgi:D-3-phosphoglycerate dehydrogenase / 2-oxoglutarate reductase
MLSMARFIPQASASTKAGKWEKKKLLGSELRGKTIGIIGLGSIGREVVKRARAFEMRILAHDPYVTAHIAKDLGIHLVSLADLYKKSDYITVHVSLTPETDHFLNKEAFAQMKKGVRLVNCARGELLDELALKEGIESGKVAGAALDVFLKEPTDATHPLFGLEQVLATPHIGGSTEEAQEIVGVRIAEQMVEYIVNGVAINAVNMPAMSPDQYKTAGPYIDLAERLGNFAANLVDGHPTAVKLTYYGNIADMNTSLLRNAGLAGVLNRSTATRANVVNAMQLASDRGWNVAEVHDKRSAHSDTVRLEIETDKGVTTVEGAVVLGKPRLMHVDGIYCEAPLGGTQICTKNFDVPGVVGHIGMVLGSHGINIGNFSLGRSDTQPVESIAVITTDAIVTQDVLDQLTANVAVRIARSVKAA